MTGRLIIPLCWNDRDATAAVIDTSSIEGKAFNGIRIDHIARVGDHFEAAYTVVSKDLRERLMSSNYERITMSVASMAKESVG
jgi:hypothetical protein